MSGTPKSARKKLSLSLLAALICTLAFVALFDTGSRITLLSVGDPLKLGLNRIASKPKKKKTIAEECTLTAGKWVFNSSIKPLYTENTCPYIDRQFSCVKNGRNESEYLHWVWKPNDCILPSFDPEDALRKIQGKRMMFIGDSIQRNQWESFVCLVNSVIPENQKSMKQDWFHPVFRIKKYNATIEFYWAPFLVESNTEIKILADPSKRIMKVDSISSRGKHWAGVDILVFNTYVWWMTGLKAKALWGSFENGEDGYEKFDTDVAYRLALRTWANWIDSNIDPSKTRVFFTTMSPLHMRSAGWGREDGIMCFNETRPVMKKGHWGTGSSQKLMRVVNSVTKRMKVPVTFINITQLSEYRIDSHPSIYNELDGKLLTDEQKADPLHFADCIHWCLPGVPDTWNQILCTYL
ncbi:hypothetical protein DM860_002791 [Cuscuta australis]|uniref:Uncharacterized protein n=1 Tax=Cuscuta australis TaxID=267555 RepID=A0A328D417_9ASTE|nr:hypothetical protein DM860_002791 [Cuscuta australis]